MQFELPMDRKQYYLTIIYIFFSWWYVFFWRLAAKEIMILTPSKYPSFVAINYQVNTFSWRLKAAKLIPFLGGHQPPSKVISLAGDTFSWRFGNSNCASLFLVAKLPSK